MLRLGMIYNTIDDETLQIKTIGDGELYEIKGNKVDIVEIKEALEKNEFSHLFVEYDDETMEMVV